MQVYLVISQEPTGCKGLVGHYPHKDYPDMRSEVYYDLKSADDMRAYMQGKFPEMLYIVQEVEV